MSWDDIHAMSRQIREDNLMAAHYREETRRINEEMSIFEDIKQRFHKAMARVGALEYVVKTELPGHPYFDYDQKIRQVGREAAAGHQNGADMAHAAGANFPLPPYTSPQEIENQRLRAENAALRAQQSELNGKLTSLNAECERLRKTLQNVQERELAAAVKMVEVEKSLREIEKDCVHHMALHYALREELARIDPRHVLVASVAKRGELADQAYETYVLSRDWSAVKELARNFLKEQQGRREQELASVFGAIMEDAPAVPGEQSGEQSGEQNEGLADQAAPSEPSSPSSDHAQGATVQVPVAMLEQVQDRVQVLHKRINDVERDCAMHLALEHAFRGELAESNPRHPLISDSKLREKLAKDALVEFERTRNWDAVRAFARGYLAEAESRREAEYASVWDAVDDQQYQQELEAPPVDEVANSQVETDSTSGTDRDDTLRSV